LVEAGAPAGARPEAGTEAEPATTRPKAEPAAATGREAESRGGDPGDIAVKELWDRQWREHEEVVSNGRRMWAEHMESLTRTAREREEHGEPLARLGREEEGRGAEPRGNLERLPAGRVEYKGGPLATLEAESEAEAEAESPSVSLRVKALGQLRQAALDAFSFSLPETQAGTLRLMQWNLKDFTTGATSKGGTASRLWAERLDNIVETVLAHSPDVVTLQELRMLRDENSAFAQLLRRLAGHGYDGTAAKNVGPRDDTGHLSVRRLEGLGFLWRKAAVSLDPGRDVVTLGRGADGDTGHVTVKTLGGLAAGLGLEPGPEGAPVADWLEAWGASGPAGTGGAAGYFQYAPAVATFRRAGGGGTERGGSQPGALVLAPVLLRVLTMHLHTNKVGKSVTPGRNERECALLRAVARSAWAAGEPLVVMGDTNTDMASNPAAWSELVDGDDPIAKNAVGPRIATNVFPFAANAADESGGGTKGGRHNDDILVPARGGAGLRLSSDSAAPPTARLPAGLLLSAFMNQSFRTVYDQSGSNSKMKSNCEFYFRFSDHRPCLAEVTLAAGA